MEPLVFVKGLAIGFGIAAPVGPIGVLCIRRSLADGRWMGLATGLGAATADAAYGAVAGFGLTAISGFLVSHRLWLGLIGGLFLCYLGVRTFLSKPPEQTVAAENSDLGSAYLSTLFLTLTNPMTIFSFGVVFSQLGVVATSNYLTASILVLGVFVGSALWWLLLSTGTALFRTRVNFNWMRGINRVSGAVIIAFGLYSLTTLLRR